MQSKSLNRLELIHRDNFRVAMQIRAACYLNDYKLILPPDKMNDYDFETDVAEMSDWFFEATEDIRKGYIYYSNHLPVGMIIASIGELTQNKDEVEVNYLFVSEHARGHQVGKRLLTAVAALYSSFHFSSLHLYNWRDLKSNQFYRHIGGEVIGTVVQSPGGKALETDIFRWTLQSLLEKMKITRIHWFSGTGGTEWAAALLADALRERGEICLLEDMGQAYYKKDEPALKGERLNIEREIFMYPVHAFDAPEVVYTYINQLSDCKNPETTCGIIAVSGGGEVWPNTACRFRVAQKLMEKAYQVTYEEMLIMPTNVLLQTETDLNTYILRALPQKVDHIAQDLHEGVVKHRKPPLSKGLLLKLADIEKGYAKKGSTYFKITDQCKRCGWCSAACPVKNIQAMEGSPVYLDHCQLCLKCIYGCPHRAIKAPKLGKFILKRYNLRQMKNQSKHLPKRTVNQCCHHLAWIGIKHYLK